MPVFKRADTEAVIKKFGHNMFGGDFVFSVSRDFVRRCSEIAKLAPNLEVQKDWRGPTHLAESIRKVGDFLGRHTPAS